MALPRPNLNLRANGNVFATARRLPGLTLLLLSFAAQAQAPLARPQLDLRVNGTVEAMVRQPDGAIVLGGLFRAVGGVARSNLARLRSDGSLDPDWNPGADGEVRALAADASGNVFVGGEFKNVGGIARFGAAKISVGGAGDVDLAWNPAPGAVWTIALDGAGSIYVGGGFTSVGPSGSSTPRHYVARFSASGAGELDPLWDPSPNNFVSSIAIDGNDLYVAGGFSSIGGQSLQFLARVSASGHGAADATWHPSVSPHLPVQYGSVRALVPDGNGALYIGGYFQMVNGWLCNGFAKVSVTDAGTLQTAWNPPPTRFSTVVSILLDSGFVYLGGAGGSQPLARTSVAGVLDAAWNPAPNGSVNALLADNGGLYVGGGFDDLGEQSHFALGRLDGTAAALASPDVDGTPSVLAIVKQHGGGTVIGGAFLQAQGLSRRRILRLSADGSLDPDWTASFDNAVTQLAVDSADDVFAAGDFYTVNGGYLPGLAKLSGSGSGALDPDWKPTLVDPTLVPVSRIAISASDEVFVSAEGAFKIVKLPHVGLGLADPTWRLDYCCTVAAMLPDDAEHLYIAGLISDIGNAFPGMKHLVRASTSSPATVDLSWQPLPPAKVTAIALDGDRLYVGGYFTTIGGENRAHLARVSLVDGTADALWNPSPQSSLESWGITTLAVDGANVLVAGPFTHIGGQDVNGLAALSNAGVGYALPAWNPSPDGAVTQLLVSANNSVLVGGAFSNIGGAPRTGIAAFADPDIVFADSFDGQ